MAILEVSISRTAAWIRVLGVGVGFAWRAPVRRAERSGERKVLRLGPIWVRALARWEHRQ